MYLKLLIFYGKRKTVFSGVSMDEPKMKELEDALKERETGHYVLRLYVAGLNRISLRAIENLKKICEENLQGRYELEVIDIYQQPVLAQGEQIIAAAHPHQAVAAAAPKVHRRPVPDGKDPGGAGFET